MKKALIIFLLIISMLLCGCNDGNIVDNESTDTQTATATDDSAEDNLYLDIERFKPDGYATSKFAFDDDETIINLVFPKEWKLTPDTKGTYSVERDGKAVGMLIRGVIDDVDQWKKIETKKEEYDGINAVYVIEKSGSGDSLKFRHRFFYTYTVDNVERSITLVTSCSEINDFTLSKLHLSAFLQHTSQDAGFGALSHLKSKDSILILGNSFINTSNIGYILQELLNVNGKNCIVEAISIGYATVETYINDPYIVEQILYGYYDVVFICGFYSSSEIDNLSVLKNYCDSSKTELVIFPAHNENTSVINSAKTRFPSLLCLNWKDEINQLIASRAATSNDFCRQDSYGHSTALAGYVGAHMIYRAIYGSVPQKSISYPIDQSYVNSKLGDYAQTGLAKVFDTSDVLYFN